MEFKGSETDHGMRRARIIRTIAILIAIAVTAASCSTSKQGATPEEWFQPLIPGGAATLEELCSNICVAGAVVLPSLHVVESKVDLLMPPTTGALSVERTWTNQRGGLFGAGWESIWDVTVEEGKLIGPLPSQPLEPARLGESVAFADGTQISFDEQGRATEVCIVDSLCASATWSPDNLTLQVASASASLALVDGRATSIDTSDGRSATYEYEGEQLVAVRIDDSETIYAYDNGRLTTILDTLERNFEYAGDDLKSATDIQGDIWSFEVESPELIHVSDPQEQVISYSFNGSHLVEARNAEGNVLLSRTYDDWQQIGEERPADGLSTQWVAPGTLQVMERRELEPDRMSEYTVDELGRVTRSENIDGVTEITYDGDSSRPVTIGTAQAVTTYSYDENGLLVSSVDADGYTMEFERDDLGRVLNISDGMFRTAFTYDNAGNPIQQTTNGQSTSAEWDAGGNMTSVSFSEGATLPIQNLDSQEIAILGSGDAAATVALLAETFAGDGADISDVDERIPSSTGWEFRYGSNRFARFDRLGRLTELRVDGYATTRDLDEAGRLIALRLPDGRHYTLTYTPAGRIASISDGTVTADLKWHGDHLLEAVTSTGTTYDYSYDEGGRLTSAELGPARWDYRYDSSGNLIEIHSPSSVQTYQWDDLGRPARSEIDGLVTDYVWSKANYDLEAVKAHGEDIIRFQRDGKGQVTAIETTDGQTVYSYSDGRISSFQAPHESEVSITYGDDGLVNTVSQDKVQETWTWDDGVVKSVETDGTQYDLKWLSPGLLGSVTTASQTLLKVDVDEAGRARTVRDGESKLFGVFDWSTAGLTNATIGKWGLDLMYDDESRVTRASIDGSEFTASYEGGVPTQHASDEIKMTHRYAGGRLDTTRYEVDDKWVHINWAPDGQPESFESSVGHGAFERRDGRARSVKSDDTTHDIDVVPTHQMLAQPTSPFFSALPPELGEILPSVLTADDVVESAIQQSTPQVPHLIGPGTDIADRTARTIMSLAVPTSVPVAADRLGTMRISIEESDLTAPLSASPAALSSQQLLEKLADKPGLFQQVWGLAGTAVGFVGSAVGTIVQLVTSPVAKAVMQVAFFVTIPALSLACALTGVCIAGIATAAIWVLAVTELLTADDGIASALTSMMTDPWTYVAIVTSVAGFGIGRYVGYRKTLKQNLARCTTTSAVCISRKSYPASAKHIEKSIKSGYQHLHTVDRASAKANRRAELAKIKPCKPGFDRDEFPPATMKRNKVSIKCIPSSDNRGAGASMGHQLRGLPDGSRVEILISP